MCGRADSTAINIYASAHHPQIMISNCEHKSIMLIERSIKHTYAEKIKLVASYHLQYITMAALVTEVVMLHFQEG